MKVHANARRRAVRRIAVSLGCRVVHVVGTGENRIYHPAGRPPSIRYNIRKKAVGKGLAAWLNKLRATLAAQKGDAP